ncbi:CLUMA_CG021184, isoform A [Clunio marinus]|uniref:CLUMA_CG021184, isoform A n=1 Tax=Clunio marinus TaxID=568069 RepID=A0A1J1J985_9DIPT|nr:CLUMA_CG021184, isoform A [Clunio marinus]
MSYIQSCTLYQFQKWVERTVLGKSVYRTNFPLMSLSSSHLRTKLIPHPTDVSMMMETSVNIALNCEIL